MGTLPGDTILFSVKLIIMYVHFLSVYVLVKPDQITFCMNMTKKVGVNLFSLLQRNIRMDYNIKWIAPMGFKTA